MKKYRAFLIIAIVLAATSVATALLIRANRNRASSTALTTNQQQPSAPSKTKPGADVVVNLEEFGDYQCPPCGQLHPGLKRLKEEFAANLNFVFRNLPLTSMHKNALAAAQAAEAARMQNRFWEMHDLLYENQDLWKDDVNPRTIFMGWANDLK